MKIENTRVFGWYDAVRSMRNPLESWDKSDSFLDHNNEFILGDNDKKLVLKLCSSGSEHRKFLRSIHVGVTLTLPLYVWSELDTYHVGLTRNSCSTMHTLGKRDLTKEDFQDGVVLQETLDELNKLAKLFRETKNFKYRRLMKQHLPSGFLLKADIDMNYEVCLNMFCQRKNHRLTEWAYDKFDPYGSICNWIFTLPYMKNILHHICEI